MSAGFRLTRKTEEGGGILIVRLRHGHEDWAGAFR